MDKSSARAKEAKEAKEAIERLEIRLAEIEKEYVNEPALLALYKPGIELLLSKYRETVG